MQETGKIIYPADIGHEARACIFSEPHQTHEVCFWKPKLRAQESRISEASPHRPDVQQREVHISSHRHETRVSTTEHETHKVCVSQVSPDKCDNQQREVRVSSQHRHETRVSKPKRESHVYSTERELRISQLSPGKRDNQQREVRVSSQ